MKPRNGSSQSISAAAARSKLILTAQGGQTVQPLSKQELDQQARGAICHCAVQQTRSQERRLAGHMSAISEYLGWLASTLLQQEQQQLQELLWLLDRANRFLVQAVLLNKVTDVEGLLGQGAPLRGPTCPANFTALHAAAISNCWRALPAMLASAARLEFSVDSRLSAVLHDRNYSDFLAELGFAYNSGLEASDNAPRRPPNEDGGVTPLHLACWEGSLDVIPILLAHSASAALTADMTLSINGIRHCTSGDALAHLLFGKGSKDAARLVQTVKLLVEHGANPVWGPRGYVGHQVSNWNQFYIANERLPLEVRCWLIAHLEKEHLHKYSRPARLLLKMYGAALRGDSAGMLHNLRQLIHRDSIIFRGGETSCLGGICLVDVLEAAPQELADLAIQELPERMLPDTWELLQMAVIGLQARALHTLLCVQGPRTFEGRVVVMDLAKSLQCLGPCPVLLLMYYLAHYSGYRAYVPVWEARATAVMAQLIEAGFKPSIYPAARFRCRIHDKEKKTLHNYDALADNPELLQKLPRRVLLALQRPAWSQANHRDFPPAFQAAVRAFLLAAAASGRLCQPQQHEAPAQQSAAGVQEAVRGLGDLPVPLLERVLGLAAYPLSAWM